MEWTKEAYGCSVSSVECYDVRFPSILVPDAPSDAVHKDPEFSDAYVILKLDNSKLEGHGFTFTIGRGQEIVVTAIKSLSTLVKGKKLIDIFKHFGSFWKELTSESQLRWIGPEKGAIHLATAALVNALWDLWAKIEGKPLWKLLVDMNEVLATGVPAYITSVGWLGIPTDRLTKLAEDARKDGWTRMKMKVGINMEDDKRRAGVLRLILGEEGSLMTDANQLWDVDGAVSWMKELAPFTPLWIEEPTSPDDVLGHAKISKALSAHGMGVGTGEHCQNRVMFKQFLEAGALQFCQIDACRLGGVNEVLSVLLLAKKFNVPVCPHAGGVGLCELVQHLAIFNYIAVSPSWNNVMVEFVDQFHEHFVDPVKVRSGRYLAPSMPGYSAQFKPGVIEKYEFQKGSVWQELQKQKQSDIL